MTKHVDIVDIEEAELEEACGRQLLVVGDMEEAELEETANTRKITRTTAGKSTSTMATTRQ